jgi:hypothetical protein
VATRTVTGSWRAFAQDGSRPARSGTVTFEPSTLVRDAVTNHIVVQDPVVATLDANGNISVELQATDQAGLNPVGWHWNVTERITGLTARRYSFLLPAGGVFDLSDVEVPYSAVPIDPDEIYIRGFEADYNVVGPTIPPSLTYTVTNSIANVTYSLPRSAAVSVGTTTAGADLDDAAVVNSGTEGDVVLDFTLPRATLELGDVTVVNPDQNPDVTDSGTVGASVFDFDLPRAPTFAVGTVTSGADETDAVVTNVGIDGDIVLDITVPRGVAATADVGTTTVVNPDQNPAVTNSGTTADAVFDFDLPRAPDFTVGTVSTLAPGSSATVTDVGVDGDIELNFELPRGQDGDGTAYYGQMYNQTTQTVSISSAGSYVDMDVTGTFDSSNSFGMVAPTTASFGVKNNSGATQLVAVIATADIEIGNNKSAGFRLAVNGVALPETTCTATTGTTNFAKLMSQWFVELDQGDEVSVLIANLTDTVDIDVDRCKIVVFTPGRQGEAGATGATGPTGVVTATAPVTYDAGTQTVGFDGSLDDLNDVSVPSPADGEVLIWDDASSSWISGEAAAGAVGGGDDKVFWENDQTVDYDYSISSGRNAMTAGPVTIQSGVTVTVPVGSEWTVV